jgi:hypothetical protein
MTVPQYFNDLITPLFNNPNVPVLPAEDPAPFTFSEAYAQSYSSKCSLEDSPKYYPYSSSDWVYAIYNEIAFIDIRLRAFHWKCYGADERFWLGPRRKPGTMCDIMDLEEMHVKYLTWQHMDKFTAAVNKTPWTWYNVKSSIYNRVAEENHRFDYHNNGRFIERMHRNMDYRMRFNARKWWN